MVSVWRQRGACNMLPKSLNALATVLKYPEAGLRDAVHVVQNSLTDSELQKLFAPFANYIQNSSVTEREENYIKTFDIQAPCYLEVGYVLFGEDYKRGHFLVKMQELHREAGHDCGTELPDFLPNVLELLPLLAPEEAAELVGKLVLSAVQKMVNALSAENVYRPVLEVTLALLKFPEALEYYEPSLDLPTYPAKSLNLENEEESERSLSC